MNIQPTTCYFSTPDGSLTIPCDFDAVIQGVTPSQQLEINALELYIPETLPLANHEQVVLWIRQFLQELTAAGSSANSITGDEVFGAVWSRQRAWNGRHFVRIAVLVNKAHQLEQSKALSWLGLAHRAWSRVHDIDWPHTDGLVLFPEILQNNHIEIFHFQ